MTRRRPSSSKSRCPTSRRPMPVIDDQQVSVAVIRHRCFGAGTLVRTLDGLRPIETLRVGDQVLTQDPKTGALKYQAVLEVYHNPPNATYRVELATANRSSPPASTASGRPARAGPWPATSSREIVLRTLGGLAVVKSVEAERVQPVFNLHVAEGESFFVGRTGVLAHDNSLVNPDAKPVRPGSRSGAHHQAVSRSACEHVGRESSP